MKQLLSAAWRTGSAVPSTGAELHFDGAMTTSLVSFLTALFIYHLGTSLSAIGLLRNLSVFMS